MDERKGEKGGGDPVFIRRHRKSDCGLNASPSLFLQAVCVLVCGKHTEAWSVGESHFSFLFSQGFACLETQKKTKYIKNETF